MQLSRKSSGINIFNVRREIIFVKVNYRHFVVRSARTACVINFCVLGAIVLDRWKDFAISFVRLTFIANSSRRGNSSAPSAEYIESARWCCQWWCWWMWWTLVNKIYIETDLNLFNCLTNRSGMVWYSIV